MSCEARVGYVSSIDYENGTCEVNYPDRDDTVTAAAAFLANGEYNMPEVDDMVLVLHLGDSPEDAVILGRYWNDKKPPAGGKKGVFRKDYANEQGKAYEVYDVEKGTYTQYTDKQTGRQTKGKLVDKAEDAASLEAKSYKISVGGTTVTISQSGEVTISGATSITVSASTNLDLKAGATLSMNAPTIKASGATVNISGAAGDVTVMGKSLVKHTHTGNLGNQTTPPL